MAAQRLPPDKGDGDGDSASAPFQPQIRPKNLQDSSLTQQIQLSQAALSVHTRDCSQFLLHGSGSHPHSKHHVASGWGRLLTRGLAPADSPSSFPVKRGSNLRHATEERRQEGVSQSLSQLSPVAQPFFPGKAAQGCSKNRRWRGRAATPSPRAPPVAVHPHHPAPTGMLSSAGLRRLSQQLLRSPLLSPSRAEAWDVGRATSPLGHEDGDASLSALAPASSVVNATIGGDNSSGQGSSLQGGRTRMANFGSCATEQPEMLEAFLIELQLCREPLGAIQLRLWDPMVEEASMCVGREEQLAKEPLEMNVGSGSSTQPPTTPSPPMVDHLPPIEGIETPMLLRSKAEQLVGYKLIKALGNLKQSRLASLSPFAPQSTSVKKEEIVTHPESNQSGSRQQKVKIKSRKPGFKVVRDMLTKKWIFLKKDRHLSSLSEVAKLLEALGLPL